MKSKYMFGNFIYNLLIYCGHNSIIIMIVWCDTVNLRVLVEKFTPRIVYVKSGVDFYAQTDIKSCRLEIGIPDVSYSQFPSVFQRSKFCKTRLLAKFSHRTAI